MTLNGIIWEETILEPDILLHFFLLAERKGHSQRIVKKCMAVTIKNAITQEIMRVTKCLLTLLSCSWLLVQATKSCDDKSSCQMTRDLLTETEEELSQCNTRLAQLTGDDSSSYISQLTSWISSQSTKGSPAAQAIAFRTLISKLLKTLELDTWALCSKWFSAHRVILQETQKTK